MPALYFSGFCDLHNIEYEALCYVNCFMVLLLALGPNITLSILSLGLH